MLVVVVVDVFGVVGVFVVVVAFVRVLLSRVGGCTVASLVRVRQGGWRRMSLVGNFFPVPLFLAWVAGLVVAYHTWRGGSAEHWP